MLLMRHQVVFSFENNTAFERTVWPFLKHIRDTEISVHRTFNGGYRILLQMVQQLILIWTENVWKLNLDFDP